MHNVEGKMICFKEVNSGFVKWYFIENKRTIFDIFDHLIPRIEEDFSINNVEIVMAGMDNMHNSRPEDAPAMILTNVYTFENVFGKDLDVAFYVRKSL